MALLYLQEASSTTGLSTYTFSAQNLGEASSDRYIIVTVASRKAAADTTISSITVGGVTATIIDQGVGVLGTTSGLAIALVPTGTTGDVVVTHSGTQLRESIALYSATGLKSATQTDKFKAASPATNSGNIHIPANGFAIGTSALNASAAYTWTGLTEDYDVAWQAFATHSGGSLTSATDQASLAVSVSVTGGSDASIVVASWQFSLAINVSDNITVEEFTTIKPNQINIFDSIQVSESIITPININVSDNIQIFDPLNWGLTVDSSNTVIATAVPTGITATQSWTYEIITKVNSFTNGNGNDGTGTYWIDRTPDTNGLICLKAVGNNWSWQIRNDANNGLGAFGTIAIDTTVPHHIALVRNYLDKFYLFVDGVLSASLSDTYGAITPATPALRKVTDGVSPIGKHYGFKISNVAKYIAAFTPPSYLTLDANTVLLWNFTAGTGTTIFDKTANANNGTVSGTAQWLTKNVLEAYPPQVNDLATISESVTAFLPSLKVNVSDNIIVSESLTSSPSGLEVNVFDSITVSENISSFINLWLVSIADDIQISESTAGIISNATNISDSITISENVNAIVFDLKVNVFDSIQVSENVPHSLTFNGVDNQITVTNPGFNMQEFSIAWTADTFTQDSQWADQWNDFWSLVTNLSGHYVAEIKGSYTADIGQIFTTALAGLSGGSQLEGTTDIRNTGPHQFVVTASVTNNSIKLYQDKVVIAQGAWGVASQTVTTMTIGSRTGDIGRAINAIFDNFRWFNVPITQADVNALSDSDTVPGGLQGEYLFDNLPATDTSGNGRDGVFAGTGPTFAAGIVKLIPHLAEQVNPILEINVTDDITVVEFIGYDNADKIQVSEFINAGVSIGALVYDSITVNEFIGYENCDFVVVRESITIGLIDPILFINVFDAVTVEKQILLHNIVPNPSFEVDTTGWDLESGFSRSSEQSFSGSYSVKQVSTSGYNNFGTHNDANIGWPVLANTNYVFSFYYKLTINSGFAPQVNINAGNLYGTTLVSSVLTSQGTMVRKTLAFNSGNNTKVYFRLYNNNGNVVGYYDAFQLELGSTANPYIDGSLPDILWDGASNNSSSTSVQNSVLRQVVSSPAVVDNIQVSEDITTFSLAPSPNINISESIQISEGISLSEYPIHFWTQKKSNDIHWDKKSANSSQWVRKRKVPE